MSEGEFTPYPRGPWPSGDPNEAEIRASIARSLEPLTVTITRGDLDRLDKMITLFAAMSAVFSDDFYDDAWNMRNGMVPFQPGDEHYDAEDEE